VLGPAGSFVCLARIQVGHTCCRFGYNMESVGGVLLKPSINVSVSFGQERMFPPVIHNSYGWKNYRPFRGRGRREIMWEKHLVAYLKCQRKEDPKNTKSKRKYLPALIYDLWARQRKYYKVYMAGRETKDLMTKERADKLMAAGIVGEKSTERKTWDEHLADYLDLKGKLDPKNVKRMTKYLPDPLRKWCINQRHMCKVYLAGGKPTGLMNKERADKLVAAGMVGEKSTGFVAAGTVGCPNCAPYSHLTCAGGASLAPSLGAACGGGGQGGGGGGNEVGGCPGCPNCAPYSHLNRAGGASLAPGLGAADGDDDPSQNSSSGLPPGRIQCCDSSSGRPYCVQEVTGQTTWDRASGGGATPSKSESCNPQQQQPYSYCYPPAPYHLHCYPPNPCYGYGGGGYGQPSRASSGGGPEGG